MMVSKKFNKKFNILMIYRVFYIKYANLLAHSIQSYKYSGFKQN